MGAGWRKLGFIILVLSTSQAAYAAEYFVSPGGDDERAGTAEAPLKTINAAMARVAPGDVCTVLPGLYRETVQPASDGTTSAPITLRAAERGRVTITGTELVRQWQPAKDGLWHAPGRQPVQQVFWQGQMLPLACWPDTPPDPMQREWATAKAGSSGVEIHDEALPPADFTGATIHVLPGAHWVSWTRQVVTVDQAGHVLAMDAPMPEGDVYAVNPGTKYFLLNHRALLDAPGEWWQDPQSLEIYLVPPPGATREEFAVEVKRRETAIDLRGRSDIRVEGLNVFASAIRLDDAQDCVVDDCHVRYVSHFTIADGWNGHNDSGIVISGSGNTLRRSSVQYSSGNGVSLLGERNTVENCLVRFVDYSALDCAAVWAEGVGNVVRQSTLSNTGRSVLVHRTLRQGRIEFNDMGDAGLMTADLGITYCFQTDGDGTVIANNWVHDNRAHTGVGIYIDNGSSNFQIYRNVSWNNRDSGIRLNTPSINNKVYHNTVLDNGNSLSFWGAENNREQPGCVVKNNIFSDKVETGDGMTISHNYLGSSPRLVAPGSLDFRLQADSPCIDAGTEAEPELGAVTGAPDQGAYEYGLEPWVAGHNWGAPPEF